MRRLESLYLDPAEAGVAWLLDPDDPRVVDGLRRAATRLPGDTCDPDALIADVPHLLRLLRERHFGIATGTVDATVAADGLDSWAETLRGRLAADRPTTWGAALGADLFRLRHLIGDGHCQARGEDRAILAAVNPRLAEPVADDRDGPAVEEHVAGGVLVLRIRTFNGTSDDDQRLADWASAHRRHFAHDRIVIDVRGNSGGGHGHFLTWMADHLPAPAQCAPTTTYWKIDGRHLIAWNAAISMIAQHGPDSLPAWLASARPRPHPGARLAALPDTSSQRPAGAQPWHGRMLVVTDRNTASAGEALAWAMRSAFGATIAGSRSMGTLRYGDAVPYLLPNSGLVPLLASNHAAYDHELTGLPVDVDLDPRTPSRDIAATFDDLVPG